MATNNHGKTRWVTLENALRKMLQQRDPLKDYFKGEVNETCELMKLAKKCTIFCSPSQNCSEKLGVLKNTVEMKCKNEYE